MSVTYKKLWKLLIDNNMSKADLRQRTGVAPSTFSRMNKNESVSLEVLEKICEAMSCDIGDVMEFIPYTYPTEKGHTK